MNGSEAGRRKGRSDFCTLSFARFLFSDSLTRSFSHYHNEPTSSYSHSSAASLTPATKRRLSFPLSAIELQRLPSPSTTDAFILKHMAATDNASPVCSCLDHQRRNRGRYLYGKGYCYKDVSSLANSRHRSTAFSDATMYVVDRASRVYTKY